MSISRYIDYVQDPNDTFQQYIEKAKKMDVRCIFAELDEYQEAKSLINDTDIIIVGSVDFPYGKMSLDEKMEEFNKYADYGFPEMEYVINQKDIESCNLDAIFMEMDTISKFCRSHNMQLKAIVEMCKLQKDEDKVNVCKAALNAKPTFLKTSTGKSFSGAKLKDVKLMKSVLDDEVKIKAAGGIRTFEFAKSLIDAGASVIGASNAAKIIQEERNV